MCAVKQKLDRPTQSPRSTPFPDQIWTICMEFGKSATKFDRPHAESCPNVRRNADPPKLPTLFPNCMHYRLNWPEKGVHNPHDLMELFPMPQGYTVELLYRAANAFLITLGLDSVPESFWTKSVLNAPTDADQEMKCQPRAWDFCKDDDVRWARPRSGKLKGCDEHCWVWWSLRTEDRSSGLESHENVHKSQLLTG